MKIAVVVGHGYGADKGAVSPTGTTEYDWNLSLGKEIVRHLGSKGVLVLRDVPYSKLPAKINALGVNYAVELHCNSFHTPKATGTETLYWNTSSKGKVLAEVVQKAIVSTLGLADRGVKSKTVGDRGATILQKTTMPTVIVETMFISNLTDLTTANKNKAALAKNIAKALDSLK